MSPDFKSRSREVMTLKNIARDSELLRELYELYEKDMMHICLSVLHDRNSAEDALHDSFIKLIKCRDSITDINSEKCKRFVLKTARNTAIDLYRRKRKESSHVEELSNDDFWDVIVTEQDSLTAHEIDLLRSLEPKYRIVMELTYIDGLTSKEIAAVLKVSESCVRKRVERAKAKLAKELSCENRLQEDKM